MKTIKAIAIIALMLSALLTTANAKDNETTFEAKYRVNVETLKDISLLESSLNQIPGVDETKILLNSQEVTIAFNPEIASDYLFEMTMKDLGYDFDRIYINKEKTHIYNGKYKTLNLNTQAQ